MAAEKRPARYDESPAVRDLPGGGWPVVGPWLRRWSVRRLGRRAAGGDAGAVRVLAGVLAGGRLGPDVRQQVLAALAGAAGGGVDEAREALCALVIDQGDAAAAGLALENGYLPLDDARKALFFLLTDQRERYERLDPDYRLLRRGYWSSGPAGEAMRRRVMERLREHGLLDAMRIVLMEAAGVEEVVRSGEVRRLADMTDQEWDLAVQVLTAQSRWPEMMRLAEVAPASRSAALLAALGAAGQGAAADEEMSRLVHLAEEWRAAGGAAAGAVVIGRRGWLAKHDSWIWRVGFSPDGGRLASGGADAGLCLWRSFDGERIWRGNFENSVSSLAFAPDGEYLVAGSWDHTVRLWRVADGGCRWVRQHEGAVTSLAFSPDGRFCVSGSWDRTVRLWRASDGECFFTRSHDDVVWAVAFSPDGRFWASGGWDGTVRLWQVGDGRLVWRRQHARSVSGIAFSPDGRRLASAGADGAVCLWEVEDGGEVWRGTQEGEVFSVAFSPDGDHVTTAGANGTVRLWSAAGGRSTWEARHDDEVWSVSFSPDGALLATAGMDRAIRVFRVADGRCVWRRREDAALFCAVFSPTGNDLASVGWDHAIRMWRLAPWWAVPLAEIDQKDLEWLNDRQADAALDAGQRAGLRLLAALIERRQRWEIEVEEIIERVPIGEFDIEIEEAESGTGAGGNGRLADETAEPADGPGRGAG